MKKAYKFGTVVLISGLVLAAVGLVNHGYSNSSQNRMSDTIRPGKFTQIELNTYNANVDIHSGNVDKVKIACTKHEPITAKVVNQKLLIEQPKKRRQHMVHIKPFINEPDNQVVIIVPYGTELTKIANYSDAGAVNLWYLNVQNLTVEQDAGGLTLDTVKVTKKFDLNLDAGSLKISNSTLTNSDGELDAGSLKIDHSNFLGSNSFSLDAGSFKMQQAKKMNYDLSVDAGSIKYLGSRKGHNFKKKIAGCKNSLAVDADMGSIVIN
ncbi:DUF4097 family beta strand repeat-containing protein [Lactobacillus sp. ESL0791]|uniref:DUF4097 family beta strand repeat-containing protein n=1 Tax=Lactobacillus sp. ESL0791 TaxID=2983234 RepID=UPI0023F9A125|nr:DUF4097 family beta strand repeat-containing protein [Lactobacillus sp. ESL0791]MDF7637915.1 DUF4097 family beta strand repeat-containing protein [Lactobacillus sp. ESL0791]